MLNELMERWAKRQPEWCILSPNKKRWFLSSNENNEVHFIHADENLMERQEYAVLQDTVQRAIVSSGGEFEVLSAKDEVLATVVDIATTLSSVKTHQEASIALLKAWVTVLEVLDNLKE